MRPLVSRTVFWTVVLLGVAGCDAPTDPEAQFRITVTPEGPIDLFVGDTLRLQVERHGVGDAAVSFTVSDPDVVEVTPAGLLTARAEGTADVVVASPQNPKAKVTVAVRVRAISLQVTALHNPLGIAVDPGGVRGVVVVQTTKPSPVARRLEVLLDSTVACVRDLTPVTSAFQAVASPVQASEMAGCTVDTARFDSLTGVPAFRNGAVSLRARLIGADGQLLATSDPQRLTLANPNRLVGRISAGREATDSLGRVWRAGDLRVDALPVLYDSVPALSSVRFFYRPPNRDALSSTDSSPPFQATFQSSQLQGHFDPDLVVELSSRAADGSPGPTGITAGFRYDQQPPAPGTLAVPEWVNAEFRFGRLLTPSLAKDAGVGRLQARFFAGNPSLTGSVLVSQGVLVSTGADLLASQASGYRLVAEVCDALENCALVDGSTFGVDRQPPVFTQVNLPDRALNPSEFLTVRVDDDRSGFPPGTIEVRTLALVADRSVSSCGPVLEGLDLPGRLVNGACIPDSMGIRIPVPSSTPGYYSYTVVPMDRAGNRGETLRRDFLVDLARPVVQRIGLPAQITSGEQFTVVVEATDDSEIVNSSLRLVYASGTSLALPFSGSEPTRAAFDSQLTPTVADTARFPFVRTLSLPGASGSARTTLLVEAVEALVTDAAGRTVRSTRAIPPSLYGGNTSVADPFGAVASITPTASTSVVCTGGSRCGSAEPTGVTIVVRASGESGLFSFARMFLFRQRVADGATVVVGSNSAPTITDNGNQRTFTYTFTQTLPEGATGPFRFFAVGVTSAGGGLKTDDLAVTAYVP